MGMFDCLVDEGKMPKEGVEYIYDLDMVWPVDSGSFNLDSTPVKIGIIVTDVTPKRIEGLTKAFGYEFTIKETGQRCCCNYPWAFWENTPDNLIKIEEYKKEKAKLDEQNKLVQELRKGISQLTIK